MQRLDAVGDGVAALPRTPFGRGLASARARLHRRRLDERLAAGESPWDSPELMIRAAKLSSPDARRRVALGIRTLVDLSERADTNLPYLKIRGRAVLEARDGLKELADRLSALEPVPAGVVAELDWLVRSERSPVYVGGEPAELLGTITERCLIATL
jgi:hypothetical protein